MKKFLISFGVILFLIEIWWIASAPPKWIVIDPNAYNLGDSPAEVEKVRSATDYLKEKTETLGTELPGYDEIILQEDQGRAFVTAMDGWIWKVDLTTGKAERFVDPPLMAAGARQVPGDPDRIYFCSSFLYGDKYPAGEVVGAYQLRISTKEISPLALRVPNPPEMESPQIGNVGVVYAGIKNKPLSVKGMNDSNSRPIAFCNDLDMSSDGKRFYDVADDARQMAVAGSLLLAVPEGSVSMSTLRSYTTRVRTAGGRILGVVLIGRLEESTAA